MSSEFEAGFGALMGRAPFPWQRRLYDALVAGDIPDAVDVPTGLGKTASIAVWLLALAAAPRKVPRRLAYVVNRRTVVDQSTREVEKIRDRLLFPQLAEVRAALLGMASSEVLGESTVLGISTLRGQFADNGAWRQDPSRPAVVLGTVDMIGSRLLFSGYGCGFKTKPLHAGLLGVDTLLVHDEAHLEPAFQTLIEELAKVAEPGRRFHVMALTATSRGARRVVGLQPDDERADATVAKRLRARKGLSILPNDETAAALTREALALAASDAAVLVFVRTIELMEKVAAGLAKARPGSVAVLTGTMRGSERERLARENQVFRRFDPEGTVVPIQGPAFLVSTSAGEVGVNISADHLVADLSTWDAMAQRLGRVNRFGDGDARVIVVVDSEAKAAKTPLDVAVGRTRALLECLPVRADGLRDASPAGIGGLDLKDREAAFAPAPTILPVTPVLLDAWSMTTPRELPGRQPVAEWLHGKADWEPPTTAVAWRKEVELEPVWAQRSLAAFPLKPHETLTERSDRALKHLKAIANRDVSAQCWLIDADGSVKVCLLQDLDDAKLVEGRTVVLAPAVGGLSLEGLMDGKAAPRTDLDVADAWGDGLRRVRTWDDAPIDGMRLVDRFDLVPNADELEESPIRRFLSYWVRPAEADDDGSRDAIQPQTLRFHLKQVQRFAQGFVKALDLGDLGPAVIVAAAAHDLGKDRAVWQRSIGNGGPEPMAKSNRRGALPRLGHYRHEFGSLHDITKTPAFEALSPEGKDLALHLVAAHHGRARPGFPPNEAFDPVAHAERNAATALEVLRRFSRLQARYGRWRLAWLESLVRAADALGSQIAPPKEQP